MCPHHPSKSPAAPSRRLPLAVNTATRTLVLVAVERPAQLGGIVSSISLSRSGRLIL